jgi:hypothetical protein
MSLGEERVVGDNTSLTVEALLLQEKEGVELDEGGQTTTRHVWDGMLEPLVEAAEDVLDEVAVLDARAKIAEHVCHELHLGGVVNDGEITLVEAMKLVAEEGGTSVTVVAEDVADGAPEGGGGGVARLHDRQGGRGDHGVVPRDNGEVVEHPVGDALGRGAVDVIPQPEFGEGGEELTTPEAVVLLLVIQRDENVVTDAESLQLGVGEGLSCHRDAEVLHVGAIVGVR